MKHRMHPAVIALVLWLSAVSFGCTPTFYGESGTIEGWNDEDAYWHHHYANEPYYANGYGYDAYQPAYLYGVESFHRYHGRRFEELNDAELRSEWERSHGHGSRLDWAHAREAAHASYNRMLERRAGIPPRPGTDVHPRAEERRSGIPHRPGIDYY
jgi:hypothetical protein